MSLKFQQASSSTFLSSWFAYSWQGRSQGDQQCHLRQKWLQDLAQHVTYLQKRAWQPWCNRIDRHSKAVAQMICCRYVNNVTSVCKGLPLSVFPGVKPLPLSHCSKNRCVLGGAIWQSELLDVQDTCSTVCCRPSIQLCTFRPFFVKPLPLSHCSKNKRCQEVLFGSLSC